MVEVKGGDLWEYGLSSNQEQQKKPQIGPRDLATRGKAAALGHATRFDQLSVRLPRPDPATLGRAPRSRASHWNGPLSRFWEISPYFTILYTKHPMLCSLVYKLKNHQPQIVELKHLKIISLFIKPNS